MIFKSFANEIYLLFSFFFASYVLKNFIFILKNLKIN
jgi:hypothetical protein